MEVTALRHASARAEQVAIDGRTRIAKEHLHGRVLAAFSTRKSKCSCAHREVAEAAVVQVVIAQAVLGADHGLAAVAVPHLRPDETPSQHADAHNSY